jgi:hypothetical protein
LNFIVPSLYLLFAIKKLNHFMIRLFPVWFLLFLFLESDYKTANNLISTRGTLNEDTLKIQKIRIKDDIGKVTEFRPGDILVKANHNWLPGTAQVFGGKGFGHAALVIEGAQDTDILRLLNKTIVFESHARDVPPEYQLRKAPAYLQGDDFRTASITFGPQNLGFCYRLRSGLSEIQIRKLINFVSAQDNGTSCWRAQKRFSENMANQTTPQGGSWYCSLLIWQAYYTIFGIDLDPNGGVMVYPNDLIAGKYFDNTENQPYKRVRF